MARSNLVKVPGYNKALAVHPDCKRYTLIDNNFQETRQGRYILEVPLSPERKQLVLKVEISKEMDKLTIKSLNGLKAVQIFNNSSFEEENKKANVVIYALIDAKVLTESE